MRDVVDNNRKKLVEALVRYELPIEPVLEALAAFEFDSEPLVILRASDIAAVLDRGIDGRLSSTQIEEWANLLEVRDDVDIEPKDEALIRDVIFRLANPILNQPLTSEVFCQLRAEVSRSAG